MVKLLFAIFVMSINLSNGIINDGQVNNATTKTIPFDDNYEHVITNSKQNDENLTVKYDIKNKDIYVECVVKDFTFSKERVGSLKQDGEGHIQLFINGNKVDSIFTPSFIIKALPAGTYTIKIELVHNDDTPYGISQEFEVTF